MNEDLKLVQEWDKVFPQSEKTFKNHFGITIVADMYEPKEYEGKLSAIAVSGPFGAVKEQSSGLYAQEIRSAVLMIHGENAHSCYMSKDAYNNMIKDSKYADNKELVIIPNANHIDLYDDKEKIPFDKIESFLKENLK